MLKPEFRGDIMAHILGIVGSPRKGGNTEILVKEAIKSVGNDIFSSLITLCDRKIEFCIACEPQPCKKNLKGVHNDQFEDILQRIIDSDGLIIGTPVYFGLPSAQMKTLMDRTRPLFGRLDGKTVVTISVGEGRFGGQELATQALRTFCLNHHMIVVGSYGCCGVAEKEGEIKGDSYAMGKAREIGRILGEYIRSRKI